MLPPPASEAPSPGRRVPDLSFRGIEPQPSRSEPRPLRLQVSTFEAPCLGRRAPTLQARSSGPRLLLIDWTVFPKIPDVPKGPPDGPLGRGNPRNGLPDRHRSGVCLLEGRASDVDVEEIAGRSGASMVQGVPAGSGSRRGDAGAMRVSRRAARHGPGGYRADRAAAVSHGAGTGAHRAHSGAGQTRGQSPRSRRSEPEREVRLRLPRADPLRLQAPQTGQAGSRRPRAGGRAEGASGGREGRIGQGATVAGV